MNNDELCCARTIVVAKAIVDDNPQVTSIKDSRSPLQRTLAQQLQEEARLPLGPCGLDQIKLFEIILSPIPQKVGPIAIFNVFVLRRPQEKL